MFGRDSWIEILVTMMHNPLRTILTSISVSVGIFILVILSGMTNGFENGVKDTMSDDATNSLWIRSRTTAIAFQGYQPNRRINLEMKDHDQAQTVEGVGETTARLGFWNTSVRWGKEVSTYGIRCVHPGHQEVERTKVSTGRYINQGDLKRYAKVAVVGAEVVAGLFEGKDPIGEMISVKGVNFTVVGTFDDGAGRWENRQIYLPITTGQMLFAGGQDRIDMYIASTGVASLPESEDIASNIDFFLRKKYSVHPNDRRGIRIRNANEEGQMINNVFLGIRLFAIGLSIMTLVIAIIGVSNIMSIVVRERTRELGIRKALGATPGSIVMLIIQESLFMTLIAGLLGALMGSALLYVVPKYIENELLQNPIVSFKLVVFALIALVVSGCVAGAIPAIRAANLKPVDALKDE
jgi:putative ABC transport system permease protein